MTPWPDILAELQSRGVDDEEIEKVKGIYLQKVQETPSWVRLSPEEQEEKSSAFLDRGSQLGRVGQRALKENIAAVPEFAGEVVKSIGRDPGQESLRSEVEKSQPWLRDVPLRVGAMGMPEVKLPEKYDLQKKFGDWLISKAGDIRGEKAPEPEGLPAQIAEGVLSAPAHLASLAPYAAAAAGMFTPGGAAKAPTAAMKLLQGAGAGALTFGGRAYTRAGGHEATPEEMAKEVGGEAALGAAFGLMGAPIQKLVPADALKGQAQRLAHMGGSALLGGAATGARGGSAQDVAREATVFGLLGGLHGGEPTTAKLRGNIRRALDAVSADKLKERVDPKLHKLVDEEAAARKKDIEDQARRAPMTEEQARQSDLGTERRLPYQYIEPSEGAVAGARATVSRQQSTAQKAQESLERFEARQGQEPTVFRAEDLAGRIRDRNARLVAAGEPKASPEQRALAVAMKMVESPESFPKEEVFAISRRLRALGITDISDRMDSMGRGLPEPGSMGKPPTTKRGPRWEDRVVNPSITEQAERLKASGRALPEPSGREFPFKEGDQTSNPEGLPRAVATEDGPFRAARSVVEKTLRDLQTSKLSGLPAMARQVMTGTAPTGKAFSPIKVTERIAQILGVKRRSDPSVEGAKIEGAVETTSDPHDINMFLHEGGHYFENPTRRFWSGEGKNVYRAALETPEIRRELDSMPVPSNRTLRPGAKWDAHEAAAEALAHRWKTGSYPANTPNFGKLMTAFEVANRPLSRAFDAISETVRQYEFQDDAAKTRGMIVQPKERWLPSMADIGRHIKYEVDPSLRWQETVDYIRLNTHRADVMETEGGRGLFNLRALFTKQDKTANAQVDAMMKHGIFDPTSVDPTSPSGYRMIEGGTPIFRTLSELGFGQKQWPELAAYLNAKTMMEDVKAGRNLDHPKDAVERAPGIIASTEAKHPNALPLAKAWNDFGNATITYFERRGIISPESAKTIRDSREYWSGLNRVFDEAGVDHASGIGKPVYHRKGGKGKEYIDPFFSLVSNLQRGVEYANKSELLTRLLETVEAHAETVPTANKFLYKVKQADYRKPMFDDAGKRVIFTDTRTGKKVAGELDPWLYRTLRGSDAIRLPKLIEWVGAKPKRAATLGMTGANVGFLLGTNIVKDTFVRGLQTAFRGGAKDIAGVPIDTVKTFINLVKMKRGKEVSPEFEGLLQRSELAGSHMSSLQGIERPNSIKTLLDSALANDSYSKKYNIIRHPVEFVRSLLDFSDAVNRLPEMAKAEKHFSEQMGLPKEHPRVQAEAARAYSDVSVNFKQGGRTLMLLNEFIPFFNASVQGGYKMGRTMKNDPVGAITAAMGSITLPAMGLWMMNRDEQWYQELPAWERSIFLHADIGPLLGKPKGSLIARLPLPFEWGYLFGSIPVSAFDAAYRKDPKIFTENIDHAIRGSLPDYWPVLPKAVYELGSNQNLFQQRPIESQSMKRMLPEDRHTDRTLDLYKALSKAQSYLPGERLSPVQMEHLVRGLSGSLVHQLAMPLSSEAIKNPTIHDVPVAQKFFSRTNRQGRSVSDFYSQREVMDRAYNSAKSAFAKGDRKRAESVLKKHKDELGLNDAHIEMMMTSGIEVPPRLSQWRKIGLMMAKIRRSPGYDPQQLTALARMALGRETERVVRR